MTTIKEQNKIGDIMSSKPNRNRVFFLLLTSLLIAFVFASCLNPFQAGLGDRVDIDRPVVSLASPEPGEFLRGVVTFSGFAGDDISVRTVQISFNGGATWNSVTTFDPSTGQWTYTVDTREAFTNTRIFVRVRVTDGSGKQTTTEDLLFTVDNEAPQIFFVFPRIDPLTYNEDNPPTVGKNGAIFGTITDREGIALGHPEVKFWADSGAPATENEPIAWTSVRPAPEEGEDPNPAVYDFRFNLPTEVTGPHWFRVAAEDVGGQRRETEAYRVVIISGAPQIGISAPGQGDAGRAMIRIEGTTSHETGNRPELELRLTARNDSTVAVTVPNGAIGGTGDSWYYDFNSTTLPNDTIIAEAVARIGDTVGFDTVVFTVDNQDPTVSVSSPGFLDTVYSQVTIRGTASDNERLDRVSLKIGADEFFVLDGTFNWQHTFDSNLYGNTIHAIEVNPGTGNPEGGTGVWRLPILVRAEDRAGNTRTVEHLLYIDQDLDKPTVNILSPLAGSNLAGPVLITGTAFDADPGVARVEMQIVAVTDENDVIGNVSPAGAAMGADAWHVVSGTTQWSREINGNGQLYSVTAAGGAYSGSTLIHNGRLRVRVRAVDLGGKEGNTQELAIRLDDTIPSITNIAPASGSYVSGTVTLSATVTDDEEIVSVAYSVDGGTTYTEVYSGAGTGTKSYEFAESIDTATGGLNIVSAVRNLRIRVRDNANYTTISTVVLNVDNYWPDADLSAVPGNPMAMAGSIFELRGTAWDRDKNVADNQFPVRGIDSIDVAFEDRRTGSSTEGEFYHLSGGSTIAASQEDLGNGQGLQPVITSANHRIRIDRTHIGSVDFKALEVDGSDVVWWTRVNTTNLPDGPVRIHMVITDRAGNRTHRHFDGFVRNNPPDIGSVTVGADLNYDNQVTEEERFEYAGVHFNARNRLYVSPAISGGNGSVTWQMVNATALGVPLTLENGNTLDVSGYSDGDYTFIVRATDAVGIVAEQSILVRIAQQDTTPPTVAIANLPVALDGHVEPTSPHNAGRPSVSGTVLVSGTASDNQRIRELRLSVPGVGDNVLAAEWEAGATNDLVSRLSGFTILSSTIDEQSGHQVSWRYQWNSATHPSVAALGVSFQISAQDFRTGSPAAVSAARTFDVVPYVTRVTTQLSSACPSAPSVLNRSATGVYPVRRGESIDLEGFNFRGSTSVVLISGATVTPVTAIEENRHIRVAIPSGATSGELIVRVSGVDSINNLNDNQLSQNREPNNVNNDTLADDRRLEVWDFELIAGTRDATFPVMRVTPGGNIGFSYSLANRLFLTLNNGTRQQFERAYNTYNWTNIFYDSSGNVYGVSSNASRVGDNFGSGARASFHSRLTNTNDALTDNHRNFVERRRNLESNWYQGGGGIPNQYDATRTQSFDMKVYGAGTDGDMARVYLVYFDNIMQQVKFRYATIGAAADGITGSIQNFYTGGGPTYQVTGSAPGAHEIGATAISQPAVGVVEYGAHAGTAVVAWYDTNTLSLRYSHNPSPLSTAPAAQAAWTNNTRTLDSFAGQEISIATDTNGGIHIAYNQASTGQLKYAYLATPAAVPQIVTVDSYLSVGTNLMIQVRQEGGRQVPYISYYFGSLGGTRNSLKLAYLVSDPPAGHGAINDRYTGNWEVLSIPTANVPKNHTVSIGFQGGQPVLGYATAEGLEIARRY